MVKPRDVTRLEVTAAHEYGTRQIKVPIMYL